MSRYTISSTVAEVVLCSNLPVLGEGPVRGMSYQLFLFARLCETVEGHHLGLWLSW